MPVDNEPAVPEVTTGDRRIANARGALAVVQATSAAVGERTAREVRYENDDGVFDARETGRNTVADTTAELLASPTGTTGVRRPIPELSEAPLLRVTAR
ncbi:hypothetical protein [Haloarcula halophila]|uniref:hypothetical protein n=1 Tax=Haloarcula TaxID=2237 RepID=UPI0023E4359F|nr:hypothetical protein [Halomicroarcula sp. DFY41]